MLNWLKSDLYRLVRGRILRWTIIIVAAMTAVSMFLVWLPNMPGMEWLNAGVATFALTEADAFTGVSNLFIPLDVIVSLVVVVHLSEDIETGFMRGVLTCSRSRVAYVWARLALALLLSAALVLSSALIGCLAFLIILGHVSLPAVGQIFVWLLLAWGLVAAHALLCALVTLLSRRKVAGVVCACLVSGEMVPGICWSVLVFAASVSNTPALAGATTWLPFTSAKIIQEGPAALFCAQELLVGTVANPASHIAITVICAVALYVGIMLALVPRRDA